MISLDGKVVDASGRGAGLNENRTLVALVGLVTLALAWVLWPLFGAVFWAATVAIVFYPLHHRLLTRTRGRRNMAAALMIVSILLIGIIPALLIFVAVFAELSTIFAGIQSGEINLNLMFQQAMMALPDWSTALLAEFGLTDMAAVQESMTTSLSDWIGSNAAQVLSFGQGTASAFVSIGVMLYLTFFLLRDGDVLVGHLRRAIPLEPDVEARLFDKFTIVVRATVRGDILVAMLQGGLGGLAFWVLGIHAAILWAVLMAFLSLLPVIGAALVWFPVALYFFASGQIWQGVALIVFGVLVVSLVDNLVRPYLVGQATRMPDYVVLISTIGGIASFGIQGFITGPVIAAMFMAVWATFLAQDKPEQPRHDPDASGGA